MPRFINNANFVASATGAASGCLSALLGAGLYFDFTAFNLLKDRMPLYPSYGDRLQAEFTQFQIDIWSTLRDGLVQQNGYVNLFDYEPELGALLLSVHPIGAPISAVVGAAVGGGIGFAAGFFSTLTIQLLIEAFKAAPDATLAIIDRIKGILAKAALSEEQRHDISNSFASFKASLCTFFAPVANATNVVTESAYHRLTNSKLKQD